MALQVDVDLHGVNAAHAALVVGPLEDARIVRQHEPEVRTARSLAETETRTQLVTQGLADEEGRDAELLARRRESCHAADRPVAACSTLAEDRVSPTKARECVTRARRDAALDERVPIEAVLGLPRIEE